MIFYLIFLYEKSKIVHDALMRNSWHQRLKGLTILLFLSGGLNIWFITHAIYDRYYEEEGPSSETIPHHSYHEVLSQFFQTPFVKLVHQLDNKEYVQDGLRKRDLALSCLVHFHYLDIERSMAPHSIYAKKMIFTNEENHEAIKMNVYPQFEDVHFNRIKKFVKREKWPFTPEGLYYELKGNKDEDQSSLRMALLTAPLLQKLASCLKRYYPLLCIQEVLELLLEGDWPLIARASEFQGGSEEMYHFLCSFLPFKSPIAASLLLKFHEDQIFHYEEDQLVIALIQSLKGHHPDHVQFLERILNSLRKENVVNAATKQLKSYGIDTAPSSVDFEKQHKKGVYRQAKKHRVQEGDSLWKLSKVYGVSFEDLIETNHLKRAEVLTIGQELIIPHQEESLPLLGERDDI